ncbi:MAG: hypothetical protein KDC67_03305 [Ignavibacteriae bacterium]|nr:hypothetical protein [Ignavibacteriota bacterium]
MFDHSDDYFYSFIPLEKDDKIYSLESKITTHPPFDNLNQLSGYLSLLMCEYLESKSKRFLNNNIFVLDHKTEYLFMRLECIEVKFETFPSGDFYIFFINKSKFISNKNISNDYLEKLSKSQNSKSSGDIINIYSLKTHKSFKEKIDDDLANRFVEKKLDGEKYLATFAKSIISGQYSKHITKDFLKDSDPPKTLFDRVCDFSDLIEGFDIEFDFIEIDSDKIKEVKLKHIKLGNNLILGNGFEAKTPKATFYNGFYKPSTGKRVQIVYYKTGEFKKILELFKKFNGAEIYFSDPLFVNSNNQGDTDVFSSIDKKNIDLILLITKSNIEQTHFNFLRKLKIPLETYNGDFNEFKMSNLIVKCIERLGGILLKVSQLHENENSIFIGLKKGFRSFNNNKKRCYGFSLFDNHGLIISRVKYIPVDSIRFSKNDLIILENEIRNIIGRLKEKPARIIFHVDGSVNNSEIESVLSVVRGSLNISTDLIVIEKSNTPLLLYKNMEDVFHVTNGNYCLINDRLGLISTTEQSMHGEQNSNPILINKVIGEREMNIVMEQIYWFTFVNSGNLYFPTRLPATINTINC